MAKLLNLDSFAKDEFVLRLFGKDNFMQDVTVDDFVVLNRRLSLLNDDASISDQLLVMREAVHHRFPSLTDEDLGKLSVNQLMQIVDFTRSADGLGDPIVGAQEQSDEGKV
jgi:Mg2+/Co2+ transporter CorC